jgi:hypothetical protein
MMSRNISEEKLLLDQTSWVSRFSTDSNMYSECQGDIGKSEQRGDVSPLSFLKAFVFSPKKVWGPIFLLKIINLITIV